MTDPSMELLVLFGEAGYAPIWGDVPQAEQDALKQRVLDAGTVDRLLPADRELLERAAAITRSGGSPFLPVPEVDWAAEDAALDGEPAPEHPGPRFVSDDEDDDDVEAKADTLGDASGSTVPPDDAGWIGV